MWLERSLDAKYMQCYVDAVVWVAGCRADATANPKLRTDTASMCHAHPLSVYSLESRGLGRKSRQSMREAHLSVTLESKVK